MNNEQNDHDSLVSATYRDSAQETTPTKLDEAVMRMAAGSNPARSSNRFAAWMTPLAWTVTAGLCVALVMNVPDWETDADAVVLPEAASPAAAIEEAFATEESDVVEEAEKMASLRDGPDQTAPAARTPEERARRFDRVQADSAAESRAYSAEPLAAEDVVTQEGFLEKKELARDPACDEASRQQAESWYECVLELRANGRSQHADNEMLALLEQFPDFQPE